MILLFSVLLFRKSHCLLVWCYIYLHILRASKGKGARLAFVRLALVRFG